MTIIIAIYLWVHPVPVLMNNPKYNVPVVVRPNPTHGVL